MNINELIGKPPSFIIARYPSPPIVRSYPDIVYFNYVALGISFQFTPQNGYKPAVGSTCEQLKDDDLRLEAVDIYNSRGVDGHPRSTEPAFSTYPHLPIELHLAGSKVIAVAKDTTGKEFVEWLGEPSRKGGGAGPSSGSIHIWCEWSQQGLMVEFGGADARGPQAWERGGGAVWRVATVFEAKSSGSNSHTDWSDTHEYKSAAM